MKVFIAPILQMGPEDYTEELLVYRWTQLFAFLL
jgi:hypothetical protein